VTIDLPWPLGSEHVYSIEGSETTTYRADLPLPGRSTNAEDRPFRSLPCPAASSHSVEGGIRTRFLPGLSDVPPKLVRVRKPWTLLENNWLFFAKPISLTR
jgi:hypothetical protein